MTHNQFLSPLMDAFNEPETLRMTQMARDLSAQGKQVIGLSLGEPDFDTPLHIKEAAVQALHDNWTHYPPVSGYMDLREAICQKLKEENQLDYAPTQIVVSTGAKQSIANLVHALVASGDEVIIPAPYWVSYSEIVRVVGGVPVFIPTTMGKRFKITPRQLEDALTPKTKLIMFSSPSNPTGSIYSKSELEELAIILEKYEKVFVMSDEIYEYINYTEEGHFSIAQISSMKERTVLINGFSKGFAMTGWRLGYMGAPVWLAKACSKLQGQFTSGANSIAQKAAVVALQGDKTACREMTATFSKRRKLILSLLGKIEGLTCLEPEGAFYVFPEVSTFIGKSYNGKTVRSSSDLSMYLLEEAFVSSVSGSAFGVENHIRFSFAASEQEIEQAMKQVKKALEDLY